MSKIFIDFQLPDGKSRSNEFEYIPLVGWNIRFETEEYQNLYRVASVELIIRTTAGHFFRIKLINDSPVLEGNGWRAY